MADMKLEIHHDSRTLRENQDLVDRLKKIEGQVRGIQRMIDEGRYCVDILTQVAAIKAGLNKVGLALLEAHTRGCVASAIKHDKDEPAVQELMDVLSKFVK